MMTTDGSLTMTHKDGWLTGCYLVEFSQAEPVAFSDFGTLRVEAVGHGYCASADLYHSRDDAPKPTPRARPRQGIPSFPLEDYRFYLRGEGLRTPPPERPDDPVILEWPFTVFEFAPESPAGPFIQRQRYTARFRRVDEPRSAGRSAPRQRWSGPVFSEQGRVVGNLSAQWLAPEFRTARLEILSLDGAPVPRRLPDGLDWTRVFAQREVNWSLQVREQSVSRKRAASRPGPASLAEVVEAAMLLGRARFPAKPRSPRASHFRLLCVHQLEGDMPGVRFDWGAFDFPRPRPRLPITTVVLSTGRRRGRDRLSKARPERELRLREALHEVGRALGLGPNLTGDGLMTSASVVEAQARALPADRRFNPRIRWHFDPATSRQLRHAPDVAVHPAGVCWRRGEREVRRLLGFPSGTTGPRGELELHLHAPRNPIPLGAPIRLHFELQNQGVQIREIPGALSLTSGHLRGAVTGPDADPTRRSFRAFLVKCDGPPPRPLGPGAAATDSLTLFRGPEGALFPRPGRYEVELSVEWCHDDRLVHLHDIATVEVSSAPDCPVQRRLAWRCLAEPELLLCHLLPSDRWKGAVRLLREIARSASPLRDHYAFTNARLAATAATAATAASVREARRGAATPFLHLTPNSILAVAELRQVLRGLEQGLRSLARTRPVRASRSRLAECLRRWCDSLAGHDPGLLAQAEELIRDLSAVGPSWKTPKPPNLKKPHGQKTTPQPVGTRFTRGRTSPSQTGPAPRVAAARRSGKRLANGTQRVRSRRRTRRRDHGRTE